ncbi:hypothetical protein [Streptomyces tendae]|uniref:hypothetical protein n=1 Tax=Streptomyces tendae TaxID=1932 RepID=UPI0036FDC4DD
MTDIERRTTDVDIDELLTGTWTVERHLSPLALFDPNRTAICAQFQAALLDDASNEARSHIVAARRHLQAAMKAPGISSGSIRHPVEQMRSLCGSLDTLISGWD